MLNQVMEYTFHLKSLRMTRQVFEFAVGYHHLYLRSRSGPAQELRSAPQPKISDEAYNEVTEHICKNETVFKEKNVKKISRRFTGKSELADVKEEEESLIKEST